MLQYLARNTLLTIIDDLAGEVTNLSRENAILATENPRLKDCIDTLSTELEDAEAAVVSFRKRNVSLASQMTRLMASYNAILTDNFDALPGDLRAELASLVSNDKRVDAIKLLREKTLLGLRECKDLIDSTFPHP